MEIPWLGTEMQSAAQRSAQIHSPSQKDSSMNIDFEAEALELLTRAKCSSAPSLLGTKVTTQEENMWVPRGSLGFILMTRLPGVRINRIADYNPEEREEVRQSFKRSWK
ncbi:hypothetical protein FQN54_002311 [Arachnomyces sp. PD_36]|nr:hypothetical protein FQN54_002311 [Arachnomyces sp. PD_36]